MTENEKSIANLTKDVAVVLSIQKGCQAAQAKTTENVDKLVVAVNTLSHDTVYLQGLETRLTSLESTAIWVQRGVIGILLGVTGSLAYHILRSVT